MDKQRLTKFNATSWSGCGELWLDPEGNKAEVTRFDLFTILNYSRLGLLVLFFGFMALTKV